MKKIIKIHGDSPAPKEWHSVLCGKWKSVDTHYRIPDWLFKKLVFYLERGKEKESLCTNCVKQQLYLDWSKRL